MGEARGEKITECFPNLRTNTASPRLSVTKTVQLNVQLKQLCRNNMDSSGDHIRQHGTKELSNTEVNTKILKKRVNTFLLLKNLFFFFLPKVTEAFRLASKFSILTNLYFKSLLTHVQVGIS